jgi:hypothetical protein
MAMANGNRMIELLEATTNAATAHSHAWVDHLDAVLQP